MNFVNTHEIIWIYRYEYKWINMYINEWNMLKRTKLIKSGLLHWHVCSQLAGSVKAVEVELCGSHQNCAKCHGGKSTWNGWAEKYTAKVLRWPQDLTKSYETLLKGCWKDVEKTDSEWDWFEWFARFELCFWVARLAAHSAAQVVEAKKCICNCIIPTEAATGKNCRFQLLQLSNTLNITQLTCHLWDKNPQVSCTKHLAEHKSTNKGQSDGVWCSDSWIMRK